MKELRINDLFSLVAATNIADKRGVYETLREILKARKSLKIANSVPSLIDNEVLFDYFLENYDINTSTKHLDNLGKIFDVYEAYLEELDTNSASDDSKPFDEQASSEEEDESDSEEVVDAICVVAKKQNKLTWLQVVNTCLAVGNIVIGVYLVLKVK